MKEIITRATLLLLMVGCLTLGLRAQQVTPKDMVEVGLHGGLMFVAGDVSANTGLGGGGFGVGIHVRKALDHIFSIRVDGDFGKATGEQSSVITLPGGSFKGYKTDWMAFTGSAIITLNNMRFDKPFRKVNIYVLGGAGVNKFTANVDDGSGTYRKDSRTGKLLTHATGGGGVSFRLSPRFNLAIEHDVTMLMGGTIDLLDGRENFGNGPDFDRTPYRDLMNFTRLNLNFNLGDKNKLAEPLYWVNPLTPVLNDISELQKRPVIDTNDDDNDGVVNAFDKEPDTPADAPVNAAGVALDSDGDGVKDYMDKEPYSPPGYKVNKDGVAMIPPEPKITEDDVNKIVDAKLENFKKTADFGGGKLTDWFLPIIHFKLNHYDIRKQEYEKLYQVATVMKNNPDIRIVVTGYTDKTADDRYNNVLSYNRAMAAIQHLMNVHGIPRDRLILNYGGENNTLVPTEGASYMNRRVEFKVATVESDMPRPEGPDAGIGPKFSGNLGGY